MLQRSCQEYINNNTMETNQNIERVYELLEKFDFNELPEQDKLLVLSEMTESEYVKMRSTVKDTLSFFANVGEPNFDNSKKPLVKSNTENNYLFLQLLKQPIQFYKVAVAIVIFIGIYSVIHYFNPQEKNSPLSSNNKINTNKMNAVYPKSVDTVTVIKERIVYLPKENRVAKSAKLLSNSKNEYDCNKEICPNDIDKITELANNDNASRDSLLRDIIALAN